MLSSFINKFLVVPVKSEDINTKSYLKSIESGRWTDKIVYGVTEHEKGFFSVNPVEQPGALYIGGMGSGKSMAMKFSLVTRMATNSEHDMYIFIDALKGMTDYKALFNYDNVITVLNDPAKITAVIDMIHEECMARKDAFSAVGAANGYAYENEMRKKDPNFKLARLIIVFEEFHSIPNNEYIKYGMKCDTPGTAAYKLRELLRISRSYLFNVMAASQRCTPDDFPSSLKPGITTLMAFRVNNPGDAAAANLPACADIPSALRGRCAYENGFMQYPYFPEPHPADKCQVKGCPDHGQDNATIVLQKYVKPFTAKLLKYSIADYRKALQGEGNSGMARVRPLKEVLLNITQYNPADVFTRVLENFNFAVKKQTNTAHVATMIAEKDGEKYAVMTISQRQQQTSEKNISALREGAKTLGCTGVIILSTESISPSALSTLRQELTVISADGDDLMRIADVLDNRSRLEEEGNFDQLFSKLTLAKSPTKTAKTDPTDDGDDDDGPVTEADAASFEALRTKLKL
jgi:hypothetical protein